MPNPLAYIYILFRERESGRSRACENICCERDDREEEERRMYGLRCGGGLIREIAYLFISL